MPSIMNDPTILSLIQFLQENGGVLVVLLIVVWASFALLRLLFVLVVRTIGWIGYYLVAAIPGTLTYFVTHSAFGHSTDQASIQAIATALLIGVIGNLLGLSRESR